MRIILAAMALAASLHSEAAASSDSVRCLALNIYHEARGEPLEGQVAVAFVTLNRTRDRRFLRTVCAVVYERRADRCQFGWTCGRAGEPRERDAWAQSLAIARAVLEPDSGLVDPTSGSTHFHGRRERPAWSRSAETTRMAEIGAHVFYRARERTTLTELVYASSQTR